MTARTATSADSAAAMALDLPVQPRIERLDNGLTVCVLASNRVALAVTALWYRAGARHEARGEEGLAHFLEHMMFRGSPRYGEGEVDAVSLAAGGSNNAFTTHDATAYYFGFARDRWRVALDLERDRMEELTLEPAAVELERDVILNELAMYEDEPWSALDTLVSGRLFGAHPYGRPVVGERAAVETIGAAALRSFHRRRYGPDNAVLVLAGDVDGGSPGGALAAARERFDGLAPRGPVEDEPPPDASWPQGLVRVERAGGEVDRLMLALPAPPVSAPEHAPLRQLTEVLAGGRSSRLYERLVERRRLCAWVGADLDDGALPGRVTVTAELEPGARRADVENEIFAEIEELRRRPPDADEIERCRRSALADWVFGTERVEEQAMLVGEAVLLSTAGEPVRRARRAITAGAADLHEAARRYLDPEQSAVVGWSRAESS